MAELRESIVAIVRCEDYSRVKAAIHKALELVGGLQSFVGKDKNVMLKPNGCDPLAAEKAATTNPLFVKAVIELVKEITPNVCVGEQSASAEKGDTLKSIEVSGIGKVLREADIKFRNLQEEPFIAKDIPGFKVLEKTDFSKAIFEQDIIINLPKFKTHGLTFVTGAVKNCFGLIHPEERHYLHSEFSERESFCQGIVDVYSYIRPKLTIMDAVVCMEGDEGPSYGAAKMVGYVIVSEDAVAADAVASKITNHNPLGILTTKFAYERGLGMGDVDKIKIVGDELKIVKDFRQHVSYKERLRDKKGLQPLISEKCVRCGACFRNCPVGAIDDVNDKYVINKEKCIRCYCCLEVCVHEAVRLVSREGGGADLVRLGIRCNESCLFCTATDEDQRELNTEEAKKSIDIVANKGCGTIAFTGGEPTIRDDLVELVKYAKEKGIKKVQLQTNGVRLADEIYLKELIEAGVEFFFIALHSHKKEVSDFLTNSKGFENTVKGIKDVLKAKKDIELSFVVNSKNYKEMKEYVDFVSGSFKKTCIHFGFIRPNGRAWNNKDLVPRLSMVEPYLKAAFDECKAKEIHFEVEGVPLCYMPSFIESNIESRRMASRPNLLVSKDLVREDTHSTNLLEHKEKSKACLVCKLNDKCPGVWKEYALIHGTDELYPLFGVKNG